MFQSLFAINDIYKREVNHNRMYTTQLIDNN